MFERVFAVCDGRLVISQRVKRLGGGCWAGEKGDDCSVDTASIGIVIEWPYICGFLLGFGIQRSQQCRFSLYVALHSTTSNVRRVKRNNDFLKYHPRVFSRGGWSGWRAWSCRAGTSWGWGSEHNTLGIDCICGCIRRIVMEFFTGVGWSSWVLVGVVEWISCILTGNCFLYHDRSWLNDTFDTLDRLSMRFTFYPGV